jgi:hypothetical protein
MKTRAPGFLAAAIVAAAMAPTGCGGTLYLTHVNGAANKVAQAKEMGAEKLAAYEYYYASEHLTKAMSEASEGDYSDAIEFADTAEQYADKAIKLSREARGGAGP